MIASPSDGGKLDREKSASRIFNEISEIIDNNGEIAQQTKDRLMLAGMRELYYLVEPISEHEKRICELEKKSLANWLNKNPKLAITLALIFFVVFSIFRDLLLTAIGLSPDLVP